MPAKAKYSVPAAGSKYCATHCTILYQAGVDVLTARDQMGHASVQVTQEIYTHLDAKYKAKKMEELDKYIAAGK